MPNVVHVDGRDPLADGEAELVGQHFDGGGFARPAGPGHQQNRRPGAGPFHLDRREPILELGHLFRVHGQLGFGARRKVFDPIRRVEVVMDERNVLGHSACIFRCVQRGCFMVFFQVGQIQLAKVDGIVAETVEHVSAEGFDRRHALRAVFIAERGLEPFFL